MSEQKKFIGLTIFSAIQSFVKLLVNFTIGKLAAIYLGTGGFGILGQFQNITQMIQNFSNAAIHNGVIKYIASEKDKNALRKLIQTAFVISVIAGIFCGFLVILFARYINDHFLHIAFYHTPLWILALSCLFFSLNLLMTSLFNGTKDFKSLALFNIIQSIVSLFLFILLLYYADLQGALISIAAVSIITFFIALILFWKKYEHYFRLFSFHYDRQSGIRLFEFSLMALFTIFSFSVAQLLIRTHLLENVSEHVAGLWEGMNRLSNFYIFFLALLFSSYILPRYAETEDPTDLKQQLKYNFRNLFLLLLMILGSTYLLRYFIISICFTRDFFPIGDALCYHLPGDFFRIMAWVMVNFLLAKKCSKSFILTDFLFHALWIFLTLFFGTSLKNTAMMYFISSVFYCIILIPAVWSYFIKVEKRE